MIGRGDSIRRWIEALAQAALSNPRDPVEPREGGSGWALKPPSLSSLSYSRVPILRERGESYPMYTACNISICRANQLTNEQTSVVAGISVCVCVCGWVLCGFGQPPGRKRRFSGV